jgi:hypothetical protein
MNIPPFWAKTRYEERGRKGQSEVFFGNGWSFHSLQEAQRKAAEQAKRVFDMVTSGQTPARYEYHDRPIKEEIVDELHANGGRIAVITRNRYGALVLNTDQVLFVDIDFPREAAVGWIERMMMCFNRSKREARRAAVVDAELARIRTWAVANPERGFRMYRTKEGLRLLFTDRLYQPNSAETRSLLDGLGADPLYVKLTLKQECFRARLTSKPWRCGAGRPPAGFPWESRDEEAKYRAWQADYERRDAGFKICEHVADIGQAVPLEPLRVVVETHDRLCRVDAKTPLA